jgi:lipopolysaccharide heptosyltransferase I
MSALGDIVHALPVLTAIHAARPDVEIDWLVDARYAGIFDLVEGLSHRIHGRPGLAKAVRRMRARRYDVAIDLQGLFKSAAMARLSGATRVVGFERAALRERGAAWFYHETVDVPVGAHIIRKNLAALGALGVPVPAAVSFPVRVPASKVADHVAGEVAARGARGFMLINPGAAWPNKRWPAERFGAVAQRIMADRGLPSYVLWGGDEVSLADSVVAASGGAATRAPMTTLGDILALATKAAVMVSGDTGPLHLAAAVGAPVVGLYGPTWPERNGPWHPDDVAVSRARQCECHHKRRCQRDTSSAVPSRMCLMDISSEEVVGAVGQRLARLEARRT